jgi:hypothetical protein
MNNQSVNGRAARDWSAAEGVDPIYQWKPLPVSDMPERPLIDYATRCNPRCGWRQH